jgi:hypothetical protein
MRLARISAALEALLLAVGIFALLALCYWSERRAVQRAADRESVTP